MRSPPDLQTTRHSMYAYQTTSGHPVPWIVRVCLGIYNEIYLPSRLTASITTCHLLFTISANHFGDQVQPTPRAHGPRGCAARVIGRSCPNEVRWTAPLVPCRRSPASLEFQPGAESARIGPQYGSWFPVAKPVTNDHPTTGSH